MKPEEFVNRCNSLQQQQESLREQIQRNKRDMDALCEEYAREALAASGYSVGQAFDDEEGRRWYVSGAYVSRSHADGHVYLSFNFAKKDGTMSKVSGLGRGMPRIRIK